MTYPAAILLIVTTDKYKAFKCFCNLIVANEFSRNLYSFNIKRVHPRFTLDKFILPDLRCNLIRRNPMAVRTPQ
jgi:hypothetical protein